MNKMAHSRDTLWNAPTSHISEFMLEAAGCGVVGMDADLTITCANLEAKQIMGLPDRGRPVAWPGKLVLLNVDDRKPVAKTEDPIRMLQSGQMVESHTYRAGFSQGGGAGDANRLVRLTIRHINDHPTLKYVATVQDVTVETAQQHEAETLRRLDALGETTGSIAHDFNNVLGAILPSVQLALHKTKDPAVQKLLERALASTRNGAVLSKRLLSFARTQPNLNEIANIAEVFDTVKIMAEQSIETTIHLKFNDLQTDASIVCDRGQLETVLLNLIFNARDAIQSDRGRGTITVAARVLSSREEQVKMVELSVTDDGSGMNDVTLKRAIDPLFSTRNHSGGGLGLSIAYGFCRQAGGGLDIRSTLGQGTTVRMRLPAVDGAATETDQAWISGNGTRILVAEGEPALRRSLKDVLRVLDYDAQLVGDGEQALEALNSGYFEMLLTDVIMPGKMDGFELASHARRLHHGIGIAYMSGKPAAEHQNTMTVRGPMIMKPCDIGRLSQVLHDQKGQQSIDND